MSGELILEKRRGTLPALILGCLGTLALGLVLLRLLPIRDGGTRGAAAALLGYVVFRALYPALEQVFGGKSGDADTWTVTPDTLYLGEKAIPRAGIRQVYCWPRRNALGQAGTGWVVNIETARGHTVLRSLSRGEDAKRSAAQLRAMVTALGYGSSWREE